MVENGVVQQLELFQEAVEPVSIVLALDASGSMKKKEAEVVSSAREFINALRPQDKLAVVLFSDHPVFTHDLTDNRAAALAALDQYRANGGTALYDSLSEALLHLKQAQGRRVVVVMTDGRDENNPGTGPGSVRDLDDVAALIRQTGAVMFGIGLGVNVDQEPLKKIAEWSGGRALFPADVSELPGPVPSGRRRSSPAIRGRVHLVSHSARWRVAEGRNPRQASSERHRAKHWWLRRAGTITESMISEESHMRTSGGGNRDLMMMTVPLAIFIVFGVISGGGVDGVLRCRWRGRYGARSIWWAALSPEVSRRTRAVQSAAVDKRCRQADTATIPGWFS